jgi:hypothetical protein
MFGIELHDFTGRRVKSIHPSRSPVWSSLTKLAASIPVMMIGFSTHHDAPDDVQYWELIRIVLSSNQRNHDILFGTPFASDLAEFETITGLQATTDCVGFRCRA